MPDDRDLPAIARLAAMRGAAEAVETILVGISVQPHRFDRAHPGGGEAVRDIGFQVELRVAGAAGGEEAFVGGVVGLEAALERVIDLVAGARDARADRGADAVALARRALPSPATSRRSRRRARPSTRHAPRRPRRPRASASSTGAQSAVRMPSAIPGRSVTTASACGRRRLVPRLGDGDAIGRMDLIRVEQDRAGQHRLGRAAAGSRR